MSFKMRNYTQSELQEMQRQAIERVQEMQKRSLAIGRKANKDLLGKNEKEGRKDLIKDDKSPFEKELEETNKNRAKGQEEKVGRIVENDETSLYSESNDLDFDKALVLSLILLLSAEDADIELILSLLYIII